MMIDIAIPIDVVVVYRTSMMMMMMMRSAVVVAMTDAIYDPSVHVQRNERAAISLSPLLLLPSIRDVHQHPVGHDRVPIREIMKCIHELLVCEQVATMTRSLFLESPYEPIVYFSRRRAHAPSRSPYVVVVVVVVRSIPPHPPPPPPRRIDVVAQVAVACCRGGRCGLDGIVVVDLAFRGDDLRDDVVVAVVGVATTPRPRIILANENGNDVRGRRRRSSTTVQRRHGFQ
jgi:hypothetical protein